MRAGAIAAIELLELTWRGQSSAAWQGGEIVEHTSPHILSNGQRWHEQTRIVVERRMAGQGWFEITCDSPIHIETGDAPIIFRDHLAALLNKLAERRSEWWVPKWVKRPETGNDSLLHFKRKLVAWVGHVPKAGFYILTTTRQFTRLASLGVAKDIAILTFLRDELDQRCIPYSYQDS